MRRTSSASIHSAAGQIATTAATRSLAAAAWIAISPPMLEPRAATRRSSTSGRAASHSASRRRSSTTVGSRSPSVSPWPRLSNVSATKPLSAARRAKSAWFSFREPAPCMTITAGNGPFSGRAPQAPGDAGEACPSPRRLDVQCGGHNARQYGGYRSQPRVPAGLARERTRPPRGGGLRRGRAGRALRHARIHLRGGRHPRAGAGLRGGLPVAHGRLRGDLRVQGAADHRGLPADGGGGAVGGRRVRRRAVPRAARRGRSAAAVHARQQQDRGRAEDGVRRGRRIPRARLLRGDRARRAPRAADRRTS